jgi:hypothetical protein
MFKGNNDIQPDLDREADDVEYYKKMLQRIARVYISSGGDAPVRDGGGGNHSIFAKNFINILKKNSSNMNSQEVFVYVKKRVEGHSSQNPNYSFIDEISHSNGEFVFSVRN